jgi:ABC-2 type transport system permease protein
MTVLAQLTGGEMVAISWRSSRRRLIAWTLGMIAVFAATAASINSLWGNPAALRTYAKAVSTNSSLYAINGRPFGLDNIGGPIAYEFGFIAAIAVPLMGVFLMTRMTRLEEETGRMELLRAGVVGRTAALKSALVLTSSALLVMGAGMASALAVLGLNWPGVVLYPLALALLGIMFTAVGALCAQLVASSRVVTALGLAVLVVAFVLRGIGDVRDNALVWLSPLGWAEQTRAFGDARWWPLLLLITAAIAASVAALRLAERRDLGEGMFARRRGSAAASPVLLGSFGFAARRHRNAVVGWSVISALVGAGFGSVGDSFNTAAADNKTLQDVLGGGRSAANAFVSFVVILVALICIGFVISGVGRAADEERDDRLEPLLAGALSRPRWCAGHAVALVVGVTFVALAGGLGLGISNAITTGDSSQVWRLMGATIAYLPAAALLLGLSAALYGLKPSLLWISWLPFVFVTVVAVLGDALQLPGWVKNISPMNWVGRVPLENASPAALIGALAAAAALAALTLRAFHDRDIPSP